MLLFVFCLVQPARLRNQVATADVVGTVTDASGAILPGATVTITNTGTGITQTTTTSGTGDLVFSLLQAGTYSIEVQAKRIKTHSAPNVALSAGGRARVDAKLEVGEATQTIEVPGMVAPALQTDTATVGTLFTSQAVEDVPLDGRNVTQLVQVAQGVNQGLPNSNTCTIVAGPYVNIVGQSLNPIGLEYFNLYPKPTNSALTNNYNSDPFYTQNQTTIGKRVRTASI